MQIQLVWSYCRSEIAEATLDFEGLELQKLKLLLFWLLKVMERNVEHAVNHKMSRSIITWLFENFRDGRRKSYQCLNVIQNELLLLRSVIFSGDIGNCESLTFFSEWTDWLDRVNLTIFPENGSFQTPTPPASPHARTHTHTTHNAHTQRFFDTFQCTFLYNWIFRHFCSTFFQNVKMSS